MEYIEVLQIALTKQDARELYTFFKAAADKDVIFQDTPMKLSDTIEDWLAKDR